MKRAAVVVLFAWWAVGAGQTPEPPPVQFLFTSDAHYGLSRPQFQGRTNVDAHRVNAAMVAKMNALPGARLPMDGGLRQGELVGAIDFVAETGDIANREETRGGLGGLPIQRASASWAQFRTDYIDGSTLTTSAGQKAPLFVAPGNHDVSNAVGFYQPMTPATDETAMIEIYNLMMRPAVRKTTSTYDYRRDRVLTSREVGGLHLMFLNVWPDSLGREWMERDLSQVPSSRPVFVFTHDQPESEAKHFTNPNGAHDINERDRFENLLVDRFADGPTIERPTTVEQRALGAFLGQHPNVVAYFHGNANWNQFYDWSDPDRTIALHTFRVDSPIKGHDSAGDETKLSFQLAIVDPAARSMTVRECLWNTNSKAPAAPVVWGAMRTVSLRPRQATP